MKKTLTEYVKQLNVLFSNNNDLYKAHELSKSILKEMADNTDLFHEIVKKNLMKEGFLYSKGTTRSLLLNRQNIFLHLGGKLLGAFCPMEIQI